MSVLVFVETDQGEVKKSSLEAICCGLVLATAAGTSVTAVVAGSLAHDKLSGLGAYGAAKVLHADSAKLDTPAILPLVTVVHEAAAAEGAKYIVFPKSSLTDAVAPRLAARLKAGLATNVTAVPLIKGDTLLAIRSIYTGKAFGHTEVTGEIKIITLKKNAVEAAAVEGKQAAVVLLAVTFPDSDFAVKHLGSEKATGEVSLPEAEIVVSGGRGLKGPENWGILLDLAKELGAATACSKPVSDLNWRPHHEHVGQTGVKVSPNLYIAIGISGAIQHVAGIASSKVIVAINSDPEAPIFKAADYGIVGNAFEVVPKLTAAFKADK